MESKEFDNFDFNEDHVNLLNDNEQIKEIEKNIRQRKAFYLYNEAKNVITQEIKPRFDSASLDSNDRGRIFFFYGDFDTGKSFLLKYASFLLKEKHPSLWKNGKFPILIIDLSDTINTSIQLYLYLLQKFGKPVDPLQLKNWDKTNITELKLREKVISTLEAYDTRILILDECQRLLKARNPNIPNIFEAFKDLTSKDNWNGVFRTNFIICGTSDGIVLLEADKFIQGRTHTRELRGLTAEEYGDFLWTIYYDYIELGISKDWDLVHSSSDNSEPVLNVEIAEILFQRTKGKAGLTVEIIRDAVLKALNDNRRYPSIEDYKEVILEGVKYETQTETDSHSASDQNHPPVQVLFDINDLRCRIRNCPKSKESYQSPKPLIQHYKLKHPEVVLVNKEGKIM